MASTTTDNHGYYSLNLNNSWQIIGEKVSVPSSLGGYQIESFSSTTQPATYSLDNTGVLLTDGLPSGTSTPNIQTPKHISCPYIVNGNSFNCSNQSYFGYSSGVYEADFAYTPLSYTISGTITQPSNATFSSTNGPSTVTVYLYDSSNSLVSSQTVNAADNYQYTFTNVYAGSYKVSLDAPNGSLSIGNFTVDNPAPPTFAKIVVGPGCSTNTSTTGASCK